MVLLRYVLLCATSAVLAFITYGLLYVREMTDIDRWSGIVAFILLLFNFAYIYLSSPTQRAAESP
ncbi:Ca2+/Na+ antiporter [Bradyrhizobium sp. LB1.3]